MGTTPQQLAATVPTTPIAHGEPPIAPEWRAFFTSLLTRTGGGQGTNVNNVTIKISQITDAGVTGAAVLASQTPQAAREAIGAGTSSLTLDDVATSVNSGTVSFNYDPTTDEIDVNLIATGVYPGTYGGSGYDLGLTVDEDGRITNISQSPAIPDIATLWTVA